MTGTGTRGWPEPPPPFSVARDLEPGKYPLLRVFPGFTDTEAFGNYPFPRRRTLGVASRTTVQVVADRTWMYVAPHEVPSWAKTYGWSPFTDSADCVAVGRRHLKASRTAVLYLDILHEFLHILQRNDGRELWDISKGYVDSPTEIEAYRFSVEGARRLGVPDSLLRHYLKVEWVSSKDHLRLLRNVGVTSPR